MESMEVTLSAGAPPPPPASEPRTYTVESGDTLWAIAERCYGDGSPLPGNRRGERDREPGCQQRGAAA